MQLLIVDDSLADALVLRSILDQAIPDGFDLAHKTTADAAIDSISTEKFDCVFLDYMLGDDGDGLDILRRVRESGNDVPIILVSGNGCEEVAVEALKQGAQDYLVKGSLKRESLMRAISNAVEKVSLQRQLQQKNEEISNFASVAAHDLQAPLRPIAAFTELLLQTTAGDLDSESIECLRMIRKSVGRMQRLLNSLLEFTRVGRTEVDMDQVDLNATLAAVVEDLEVDLESCGAAVHIGMLPTVHGHEETLRQLFQNLVANAIKFCKAPTVPAVTIESRLEGDNCVVTVADNGIGIAPDDLERIFAPFSRLSTQFEGTGIGLATCQKIVEHHRGQIHVDSEPDAGTRFHITLPIANSTREPETSTTTEATSEIQAS